MEEIFNFNNPNTEKEISDASVFGFYVSSSFENKTQVRLIDSLVSDTIYEFVTDTLISSLDINDDGKTDETDIKILWIFFSGNLTSDVYTALYNSKTLSFGNRKTYDDVFNYLTDLTKKNLPRVIKSDFLKDLSVDSFTTGSNLTPYITSIGLYNGLDLVAVAKLGSPIKNAGYFPLNFIVRFDI